MTDSQLRTREDARAYVHWQRKNGDACLAYGRQGLEEVSVFMGMEECSGVSAAGGFWVGDIAAGNDTRKKFGEQVEAAFLHKVTGQGLSVAKPWGDSERYDLVVDSGRRLWRVQVKSTRYVGERRFSITARGCTAAYTEDEIDFLAAYIVPLDIWYVIPVKAFAPRKCLRFYPEGKHSHGQYEKYREAWWLMRGYGVVHRDRS